MGKPRLFNIESVAWAVSSYTMDLESTVRLRESTLVIALSGYMKKLSPLITNNFIVSVSLRY